ncbi:FAD-dependent oxidoreductase [Variovorax sp. PCZ-1]|uniref:FAD-dependent oxidoreductase n=1 Tax=Variovorax sp. PCZ-1 TaxID=2835533 RepID=UPI001BCF8771|nr:FAD-dependent oxidoreductase [Variovorax sp. PCZ-1]MBS7807353.1 FAD-dependent oxidoreductase [Variovorax sp. PCZ-1]
MNIIVIGAGLAGAACAQALAARGCQVTVLSQGGGASELPVGLLAAHLSSQDIELSQLSRIGLAYTLTQARALLREGIDWQPCVLEQKLLFHFEKNTRLSQGAAALPEWYTSHESYVLHKQAAWIKPQALVKAWLNQPHIVVQNASVAGLKREADHWLALDAQGTVIAQAPSVVLAGGAQVGALLAQCGHAMLMDMVPGSVALGAWPVSSSTSPSAPVVNGNGHFIGGVRSESDQAIWLSGSTYEREAHASAAEQTQASLQANLARLSNLLPAALLPAIQAQFASGQVQSWQGSRCTTSDRLPIVGKLEHGLYVCTAMGSRGLSFAAMCAEILAQDILPNEAPPLISTEMRRLLLPKRKTLKVIPA